MGPTTLRIHGGRPGVPQLLARGHQGHQRVRVGDFLLVANHAHNAPFLLELDVRRLAVE